MCEIGYFPASHLFRGDRGSVLDNAALRKYALQLLIPDWLLNRKLNSQIPSLLLDTLPVVRVHEHHWFLQHELLFALRHLAGEQCFLGQNVAVNELVDLLDHN